MIGDDLPDDAIYRGRKDTFSIRRIDTARRPGEPFNYAAKMNRLWREAETDAIVLMNDDVVVRTPGWLEALPVGLKHFLRSHSTAAPVALVRG